MDRRVALALLVLALLTPLALLAAQPLPTQQTGVQQPPPGNEKAFTVEYARWIEAKGNLSVLEVAVTYYGDRVLLDVKASLEPGCGGRVVSLQPVTLGSWPSGATKVVRFTVDTSKMGGRCTGVIAITWKREWDPTLRDVLVPSVGFARLQVDTSYCGAPTLSVEVSPTILYMDRENTVTVRVGNTGRFAISDITVDVLVEGASVSGASYPVQLKASRLEPGEWRSYTLRLVPSSPVVALTFRSSYANCMGQEVSSTTTARLAAVKGQAVLVAPLNGSVAAGETREVEVKIVNLGSVELTGVRVALSAQGAGIALEPQLVDVGDIPAGGERVFTVRVAVPETAVGSIPVSYTLSYKTPNGGVAVQPGSFTLFVVQSSQVYVTSVDVVPQEPRVGDILVLSVNIVNDGGFPVYGVNVSASAGEGLRPLRATYSFLGRLEAQAVTSVPFSYKVEAPGRHTVTFTVVYRDAYGKTHRAVRSITVNAVQGAAQAGETGKPKRPSLETWWPLIAALVGVAVVVVAWKLVKRR